MNQCFQWISNVAREEQVVNKIPSTFLRQKPTGMGRDFRLVSAMVLYISWRSVKGWKGSEVIIQLPIK